MVFQTFLSRRGGKGCCQFFLFAYLLRVAAALFCAPVLGDVTGAVFLGFVEYLGIECGATVLEERDAEGEVEHPLLQGGVDVPVVHEPCGVFFGDDDEGVVGGGLGGEFLYPGYVPGGEVVVVGECEALCRGAEGVYVVYECVWGCDARHGDYVFVEADVYGGVLGYGAGAGEYGSEGSVPECGEVEPLVGV